MNNGTSEIDDPRFFLAEDGKTNAKNELNATLKALFNEKSFDDNSTACLFPARTRWLQEKLNIQTLPKVTCQEYNKIYKRLDPQSVTLVFPAAHINSPASMFGHTFLRINSSYNSQLLSYAVNYAADVNTDTANGFIFAIKGLFGGYLGKYSLLPYYDKLKEYRDSEQRNIWEYDLKLSKEETQRMVEHIWELNNANSFYYFFTENCSYNLLWLLEIARPNLKLRENFTYNVIPLETVHLLKEKKLISNYGFRASKRSILLSYEKYIDENFLQVPQSLITQKITLENFLASEQISQQQKMYILEASIEYLEYSFMEGKTEKDNYLKLFHNFSSARASLGSGEKIQIKQPPNPIFGHQAIKISTAFGTRNQQDAGFLSLRLAYHSLDDSSYGFLSGTEIKFMHLNFSYINKDIKLDDISLLSIVSLAQRSTFFKLFSWRTKFALDRDSLDYELNFLATIGAGMSWGNKYGYIFTMLDPFIYLHPSNNLAGLGVSIGAVLDSSYRSSTNIEYTNRFYATQEKQNLLSISHNFRINQNLQIQLKYQYQDKKIDGIEADEKTSKVVLNYYF